MVFPAWVPTDALLLGLLVFLGVVLFMNRNRMRMVNVVFEREAFVVGGGVVLAASNTYLADTVGALSADAWIVFGLLVSVLGFVLWSR